MRKKRDTTIIRERLEQLERLAASQQPATGERLAERFEAANVRAAVRREALNVGQTERLEAAAKWIREECEDLLTVQVGNLSALTAALQGIQRRRLQPARYGLTASPLMSLVGRWQVDGEEIYRDGVPIPALRSTAPRSVRLNAHLEIPEGKRLEDLIPRRTRTIRAALDALKKSGTPLPERTVGRSVAAHLERLGIVEICRAPEHPLSARSAILALIVRPRRVAEIGRGAADTLRAKGWIAEIFDEEREGGRMPSSRTRALIREAIRLCVGVEPPPCKLPAARSKPSRLAIATAPGDRHADAALLEAWRSCVATHADGDAIDRALFIQAAYMLRNPEVRGLKVRDVDLSGSVIRVERGRLPSGRITLTKTALSARMLPILPEDRALFARWIVGRHAEEWLITDPLRNAPWQHRRNERAREVGFRGQVQSHDHRHTGATLAALRGVPLVAMAKAMGHVDTSMLSEFYLELTRGVADASVFERLPQQRDPIALGKSNAVGE